MVNKCSTSRYRKLFMDSHKSTINNYHFQLSTYSKTVMIFILRFFFYHRNIKIITIIVILFIFSLINSWSLLVVEQPPEIIFPFMNDYRRLLLNICAVFVLTFLFPSSTGFSFLCFVIYLFFSILRNTSSVFDLRRLNDYCVYFYNKQTVGMG